MNKFTLLIVAALITNSAYASRKEAPTPDELDRQQQKMAQISRAILILAQAGLLSKTKDDCIVVNKDLIEMLRAQGLIDQLPTLLANVCTHPVK